LGMFLPQFIVCLFVGEVLILFNKLVIGNRSPWQTWGMYLKDVFTDWNEYQVVWVLYFMKEGAILHATIATIAILIIYLLTIKWAYP